jgi:hypothetical protein
MRRRPRFRAVLPCAALFAALAVPAAAQDKSPATCTQVAGVLLARSGDSWKPIKTGEAAPAGVKLVSLFDSTLKSANGGVEARLVSDVAQRGPLPILEPAVVLHNDPSCDLALTALRGLIVLTNTKAKGAATIRLSSHGDALEVTLKEPGARLALEIYGRHAPGPPHLENPKDDEPVMHLFFINLVGEAFLRHGENGIGLHAPPGPAVLVWDSLLREPEVQRLETLPEYVLLSKEKDKVPLKQACDWAAKLAGGSMAEVLKEGAASKTEVERHAAVTAMGALDDVPQLVSVLATSPYADTRDHACLVLRNWLGREAGQTARLDAFMRKAGYTEPHAHTILDLLYGFTREQRREPATYGLLVDYLKHSQPAVRELAHWHLVRLAPAGKSINYDPTAAEAERQRGHDEWRALIPPGKLPPAKSK